LADIREKLPYPFLNGQEGVRLALDRENCEKKKREQYAQRAAIYFPTGTEVDKEPAAVTSPGQSSSTTHDTGLIKELAKNLVAPLLAFLKDKSQDEGLWKYGVK
jgi:hypothetical protein